MPFSPILVLGSLVFTFINFLKSCTNKNWSAATTQGIAWLSGIIAVFLAAQTDWAGGIVFGDRSLAAMNNASLVLVGLMASSLLGVVNEVKKALDNTDSARQPELFADAHVEENRATVSVIQVPVVETPVVGKPAKPARKQ